MKAFGLPAGVRGGAGIRPFNPLQPAAHRHVLRPTNRLDALREFMRYLALNRNHQSSMSETDPKKIANRILPLKKLWRVQQPSTRAGLQI